MSDVAANDEEHETLVPLGAVLEGIQERTSETVADVAASALQLWRTPPAALDAERAVLGALLLDDACFDTVIEEGLTSADFYRPQHRTIFSTMEMLSAAGEKLDTLVVVDALHAQGKLDYIGGSAAIAQLEGLLPTVAHAAAYARLVHQKAILRSLIIAGTRIVESAYAQNRPVADVISAAERDVLAASKTALNATIIDRVATIAQVVSDGIEGRAPEGLVPTGFRDLDPVLRGGFRPGQFVLLAARPGMGKTSLALSLASYQADRVGPIGFISLEMTAPELLERELAQESKRAPASWTNRVHGAAVVAAGGRIENRPLHIIDRAGLTIGEVCSSIRRLHSKFGIKAAYVDHLGKIRASERYKGKRTHEIEEISNALDAVADQLRIPVIALSQLSRDVEKRSEKRPNLSDLRDSGALEQDADVVVFVHRPGYYSPDDPAVDDRLAEFIVAKNRGGAIELVNAIFDAPTFRFMNRTSTPVQKASI